jgi:hypothetical protein
MQNSSAPSKFPIPFANAGTANTIPTPSQIGITTGAASLTDGFPPITFTPLSSGGQPPFGADFNGILKALSAGVRWSNAGGVYARDSTFQTAIGGYPKGAIIANSTFDNLYLNLSENNTTDPDSGGAGWTNLRGSYAKLISPQSITLTANDCGKFIYSTSRTITLPLLSSVWSGATITIFNVGALGQVLSQSPDYIIRNYATTRQMYCSAYSTITFVCGGSGWICNTGETIKGTAKINGNSSAGTATYTRNKYSATDNHGTKILHLELEWTGHTGTGDLLIVDSTSNSRYFDGGVGYVTETILTCDYWNFALPSNTKLLATMHRSGYIILYLHSTTTGAFVSYLQVPSAGGLIISGAITSTL